MLTLYVEVEGVLRRFDTTALAAGDLTKPLRMMGGHLREKAMARYRAQAFAPLAESTIEKRAQKGLRKMEKGLGRDIEKSTAKAAGPDPTALALTLATMGRSTQKKIAMLVEFQRRHRVMGRGLMAQAGGVELSLKQQQSLSKRTVKAVQKAIDRPILGTLPQTLEVDVENGTVTLASRVGKHWTDVHNAGGAGGHGAEIPQRETILVEEEDLDFLIEALREHHLLAFESAR